MEQLWRCFMKDCFFLTVAVETVSFELSTVTAVLRSFQRRMANIILGRFLLF